MSDLLGTFEQAVLLAIVRIGPDAYGRTVLHQVQQSLQREVSAGAVYTTLDRLHKRGLLHSSLAEGTPIRGGRSIRYYRVTAEGMRALNETHRTMTTMWKGFQLPAEVSR